MRLIALMAVILLITGLLAACLVRGLRGYMTEGQTFMLWVIILASALLEWKAFSIMWSV